MSSVPIDPVNGHGHADTPDPDPRPLLRKTVIRPAAHPDPVDAAFVATRLTTLTHDLANLLDGSLRVVGLAQRAIDRAESGADGTGQDPDLLDHLTHKLTTVHTAMLHMSDMVKGTMMGLASPGDGALALRSPVGMASPLAEAIEHAVDVMRPLADERAISMNVGVSDELRSLVAGPIYTVVVSAVRNAIDSIQRLGPGTKGTILVRAWTEPGRTGSCVVIEVLDDGIGPPHIPSDRADSVFRLGYTTKPGGSGVGLAVSLDVVHQLGGTIQLLARPRDPSSGRAGALLRVCYPTPPDLDHQRDRLSRPAC